MNILCPSCQKLINVPDASAGQSVRCPECAAPFTAPGLAPAAEPLGTAAGPTSGPAGAASPAAVGSLTAAQPTPLPADDGLRLKDSPMPRPARPTPTGVPPRPEPRPEPRPASPPAAPPPGYLHNRTYYVSPRVMPWVAPVCLVLVLILLWAPWITLPPNGTPSQSGWGTGFGSHYRLLGTLHILLLIVAVGLALASPAVMALPPSAPPWARQLWPWRSGILGALTLLSLMFFALELASGFGLELAEEGGEVYYHLRRTGWLDLAVLLQIASVVGAFLEFWLILRRDRPLPRVEVSW